MPYWFWIIVVCIILFLAMGALIGAWSFFIIREEKMDIFKELREYAEIFKEDDED